MRHLVVLILAISACTTLLLVLVTTLTTAQLRPTTIVVPSTGKWRLLQLTDTHFDQLTTRENRELFRVALEISSPDLVCLTGDILGRAMWPSQLNYAISDIFGPLVEGKFPWMYVYGNHETDFLFAPWLRRLYLWNLRAYEHQLPGSLTQHHPWTGSTQQVVYLVKEDTNQQLGRLIGFDTVNAAGNATKLLKSLCARDQQTPSILALHIPLNEYRTVWEEGRCAGTHWNYVGPLETLSEGFLEVAREQCNVRVIMAGHDHLNNWCCDYEGILWCYARATGHLGDCGEHWSPIRTYEVDFHNRTISSWVMETDPEHRGETSFPIVAPFS